MKFLNKNYHYFLLISAVFFLGNPAKFPADDGFFYPQVAYNIVHNSFMGFNDLYLTNGFHPLWMIFCVLAELLNPFNKIFSLNIIWVFQALLFFFGFRLLDITIFKESAVGKISALAFYCLVFFSFGTLYLTEAHLAFFTLSLLIYFCSRKFTNDLMFGFICSLVFLARLDHIFIIFPFGFMYWKFRDCNIRSLVLLLAGFSILSLPYLFSNFYLFNYIVPISGKIKSSFPVITDQIPLGILFKFCFLMCFSYFMFLLCNKKKPQQAIRICLVTGSLLHFFYNIFYQSQIGQWYFVSQFMICGFFINDIFEIINISFLRKKLTVSIITTFLIIFVAFFGYMKLTTNISLLSNIFGNDSRFEEKDEDKVKEIAMSLENFIPHQSRIYVYDFPGKFAFYSDFNFIPADGLVGNPRFFDEIDKMKFKDYMQKNNINYLLFPNGLENDQKELKFMGLDVKRKEKKNIFYLKNTMNKRIVDSLEENELDKVKSFENPAKTWQPRYDSVAVYKLK